jgi:thymidylate kinase
MLVIWIEGTDNTGKTTLAKELAQAFNLDYTHCAKPKTDNPFIEYSDMIDAIDRNSVFDRGYLGEFVYSNLWRGGCKITSKQFEELDLACHLKFQYVILIHATAPIELIRQRCIKEKEDLLQLDQIEKCSALFQEIVGRCSLPKIVYDSSSQTPQDIVHQIRKMIHEVL